MRPALARQRLAGRVENLTDMQVRVVTMRYSDGLQGFPEDALKTATFGKTVLGVSEHFFLHGNIPHLALVLQLGDAASYENAGGFRPRGLNAPDPMEDLADAQKGIYRALKVWRNETAKAEGRPAYAIARNAQLAELVKTAPKTKADIKEVAGLGEAFCGKYGERVLALLSEVSAAPAKEDASAKEDGDTENTVVEGELPL